MRTIDAQGFIPSEGAVRVAEAPLYGFVRSEVLRMLSTKLSERSLRFVREIREEAKWDGSRHGWIVEMTWKVRP